MKEILKLEEAMMFTLSVYLFVQTDFAWWWFPALILAPDVSMLGYLVNPRIGAFMYNLFHHKALAIVILLAGWYFVLPSLVLSGIILFGHSSLDRVFGYGLKYSDNFQHTHLGKVGKS
ncbi:MAG: DUF4260 domain-containing protein [Cytophagales bacterium]|nr:DUF4260 domain-containing protein [Cytophagales bacterium]